MVNRRRRPSRVHLLETLESRTLCSTSTAVLVMQAPTLPAQQVQTDVAPTPTPANSSSLDYESVLHAAVRVVPGGIYVTIAASSKDARPEAPTGTVDVYSGLTYLTTVKLGASLRTSIVLPAGRHTILVTYKGDANFGPSQTATFARLDAPTQIPVTTAEAGNFPKNNGGARIRPTRLLSKVNYFDAQNLSAGTTTPLAGAIPPPPDSSGNPSAALTPPPATLPTPRFANISFSSKLPRIYRIR